MKHIVQLIVERDKCTEYQVFEAAALALCQVNHKTQAHIWWQRYQHGKRQPVDGLMEVPPEVINYLLSILIPPNTAQSKRLLKGGVA